MKVLITDMRHSSMAEERRVLEPFGITVDSSFSDSEEALIRHGQGAAGFLVSYAPVTRRVMEALPELKIIVKYGVGVENIDVGAARELGKVVANVPDYCAEEVALQALTLALNGLRRACAFAEAVSNGHWTEDPGGEKLLRPSRAELGLLGFGRIARRLASYMEPLVGRICYCDPYVAATDPAGARYTRMHSVEELAERCRIVSLHAPLNRETAGIVGREALARARGLILVNTSRAGLVDRQALEEALDAGRVAFFAADVFWREPPDYSDPWTASFLKRRQVLVTPHMGWYSEESETELRRKAAEEVLRVLQGGQPLHPL